MYKQHLNTIVRYASQKVPELLEPIAQAHNISNILETIESESHKEVNQERQEKKKKSLAPLKALKAAWKLKFLEANTSTEGVEEADTIQQEGERMSSRPPPKAGILRIFGKQ